MASGAEGSGRGAPGGGLWNVEALSPSTSTRVSCLALLYPPSPLPPQSQAPRAQKQESKKGRGLVTHKGSFCRTRRAKHLPPPQNKCPPKQERRR